MKSIRYKIASGYALLVAIIIGVAVVVVQSNSDLSSAVTEILLGNVQSVIASENMVRCLDEQRTALREFQIRPDSASATRFSERLNEFPRWFQIARGSMAFSADSSIVDSIDASYGHYLALADSFRVRVLEKRLSPQATQSASNSIAARGETIRKMCYRALAINENAIVDAQNAVHTIAERSAVIVLATSGAAVILSILAAIKFSRSIIRPAEELTRSVRLIGEGRLNQKIDISTDDEIGVLSREFNKMTERLRAYEQMNIQKIITEKKKSETIVNSIADPLLVTDSEGLLVLMNKAAADMLNVGDVDWEGRPVRDLVPTADWKAFWDGHTARGGGTAELDTTISLTQPSGRIHLRPRQATVEDFLGHIQWIVTSLQDVTRLKDLDELKSDFLATVSHELRTPLTSLQMSLDILLQNLLGPLNEPQRELAASAKEDSGRLTKLVKQLLDLSRLESGKYELKRERTSAQAVVEAGLQPLQLQMRQKGVSPNVTIESPLPDLFVDRDQMSWVVTNLVGNALRYTPEGGTIGVSVRDEGQSLLFCVADNGRGIPREAFDTLFDKFVQVKAEGESTPGSVGLGLAIAKQVVEAHGGSIWLESELNRGSRFYFRIPIEKGER
jgi:two-component system, NtrC family, sensor histidine kinase KinB